MCPVCLTTAAFVAAGTGAAAGLTGLVLGRFRPQRRVAPDPLPPSEEALFRPNVVSPKEWRAAAGQR